MEVVVFRAAPFIGGAREQGAGPRVGHVQPVPVRAMDHDVTVAAAGERQRERHGLLVTPLMLQGERGPAGP
ncbi:hypothetical protein [Streptomyces sp. LaBMicrA B280]|uniref:hypothetical protein n=1 Tax=Streptomyces sp. LaBMicrA B280 TaxID=3391001 RepID=UPI003BA5AC4F